MLEGLIVKIVQDADRASTFDDIHAGVQTVTYVTRQRLKDMLAELANNGKIERKKYKISHPDASFMNIVVADIFYSEPEQREKFERDTLPRLETEKRNSLV